MTTSRVPGEDPRGAARPPGGGPAAPIAYALVDAPWGPVHLAASPAGVVAIEQLTPTAGFLERLRLRTGGIVELAGPRSHAEARRSADAAAEQLDDYLRGRRAAFDLRLMLGDRPSWDRAVLGGVAAVPWGEVTSYGRVARRVGRPGAARAVGGAVGRNPIAIVVPCHRVVSGDGNLGGYGGDWLGSRAALLDVKRELLRLEGVTLPATRLFD